MEDMERYGDYNEIDDAPRKKGLFGLLIKLLFGLICLFVVGVIVFRLVVFNMYPKAMKRIYFNDTLLSYYDLSGGEIGALTQKLRSPYDDADKGNFFCDYLVVIPGINQLQITVKYNVSTGDNIKEHYKLSEYDIDAPNAFYFRLCDNYGNIYGNLVYSDTDSMLMYRYHKLVFEGIDFYGADGIKNPVKKSDKDLVTDDVKWIRLEIMVKGHEDKPFGMIPVYEYNEAYSEFEEYELSSKEVPSR